MKACCRLVWLMSWGGVAALACGNGARENVPVSSGESALSAPKGAAAQHDADEEEDDDDDDDVCSVDTDCDSDEACLGGLCQEQDDDGDDDDVCSVDADCDSDETCIAGSCEDKDDDDDDGDDELRACVVPGAARLSCVDKP